MKYVEVILCGWKTAKPHLDVSIRRNWNGSKRYYPTAASAYRIDRLLGHRQMNLDFVAFDNEKLAVFYNWRPEKGK